MRGEFAFNRPLTSPANKYTIRTYQTYTNAGSEDECRLLPFVIYCNEYVHLDAR